jgi:hypothetical protein
MGFLRILFYGLLQYFCCCCTHGYCGAAVAPMVAVSMAAPHAAAATVDLVHLRLLPLLPHSQELLCDCCSRGGYHVGFRDDFRGCYSCSTDAYMASAAVAAPSVAVAAAPPLFAAPVAASPAWLLLLRQPPPPQ